MIAEAEDLLYPGKRPAAQVGILAPRSSYVWDTVSEFGELASLENMTEHASDYGAEVYGLYLALNVHANIQVDMLDEDMASTQEALSPLKLLIITEPNVPVETMDAVGQWVRRGGTLMTTSGAAKADRLNDPRKFLENLSGIAEEPRPRLNINYETSKYCCCPPCPDGGSANSAGGEAGGGAGSSWPVAARGTMHWPEPAKVDGPFDAIGIRSKTSPITTTTPLGTFADGSTAVQRVGVGKGSAIHWNFLPGLSCKGDAFLMILCSRLPSR